MPGFKIYRLSYAIISIPIFIIIFIIKKINYPPLNEDLTKCLNHIKQCQRNELISDRLLLALIVAEDHRNGFHFGVDPLAMLRAIKIRIFNGKHQGASTIEQQYVRTITRRYERTLRRKFREQILAVMLNQQTSKKSISISYLNNAFYGSGIIGVLGVEKIKNTTKDSFESKCIAYLKYPKPISEIKSHTIKHTARYIHIEYLLQKNTDKNST